VHASGLWECSPGPAEQAFLAHAEHAWFGPAWLTLRLCHATTGIRRDICVWRASMPPDDWRALRCQVLRQAAMPGRTLTKETE